MDDADVLLCADKLTFDSKEQAEGSAVAIKHQRGVSLKTYECLHCGLWHLASV
jgi:hypothetical protein